MRYTDQDFLIDSAMIYYFANTFSKQLEIPSFTPQELETELKSPSSELITNILIAMVGVFPAPARKKIETEWPYLLKRLIDHHLYFDFETEENPMTVMSSTIVDPADIENHPFYSLDLQTRMNILKWLINWVLVEHEPIRQAIQESTKKGRKAATEMVL